MKINSKFLRSSLAIVLVAVMLVAALAVIPTKALAASGSSEVSLTYRAHSQSYGWKTSLGPVNKVHTALDATPEGKPDKTEHNYAGTTGESKRVEALQISFVGPEGSKLHYRAYVQGSRWQDWRTANVPMVEGEKPLNDTDFAGTTGESLRLEGIQIAVEGLTGYEVYYRAHVQSESWQKWIKAENWSADVEASSPKTSTEDPNHKVFAGTTGHSLRVEAIQIAVVKTGEEPPVDKTVEDIKNEFNTWLNESGLNAFELDSVTKYSELSEFKTIIDAAQENLGKATDTNEAETVVATAKTDLVAKAKAYTENKLKEVYQAAGTDGYILETDDYKDAYKSIENSNDVADILKIYENTINNRMSTEEYNLKAAKTTANSELDEYVETKNADLKKDENKVTNGDEKIEVTLDDAVTAKLNEVVNTAKANINEAKSEDAIEEFITTAESDIDTLYALAKRKVEDGLKFESNKQNDNGYGWQLARLNKIASDHKVDEATLATLKEGLDEIANTARVAMAETVTDAKYSEALKKGQDELANYVNLVKEKLVTKDALTEKATSIKNANKEKYTDADNARIDSALEEALKLLEAETVVDAAKVAEAQTAGEKLIDDAKLFNGSAEISRNKITAYVDTIKNEIIPNSETLKYVEVEGIKSVVDDELAKIDTRTTPDELVADRTLARKNIYEAVRAYMVQLLDELSKLTATKDTDNLLSVNCYKNLATSKETLTTELVEKDKAKTYDDDSALSILVTSFKSMASVEVVTDVREDMITILFNSDEDIAALAKNIVGSNGTYDSLATIKTTLDKVKNSINTAKSYAEYETALSRAKTELPTAVNTELVKLVPSVIKSPESAKEGAIRKINAASTVKEKVLAYETACAAIVKEEESDVTLTDSATALNASVVEKGAEETGLDSVVYDTKTNTVTFTANSEQASSATLIKFLQVGDENNNILTMFNSFADGATKATYTTGGKTVTIDDLPGKMASQDLQNGIVGVAAGLLLDMAGEEYEQVTEAVSLTYEQMIGKKATATFYFVTENGVEYSVDYTLEFVKGK